MADPIELGLQAGQVAPELCFDVVAIPIAALFASLPLHRCEPEGQPRLSRPDEPVLSYVPFA